MENKQARIFKQGLPNEGNAKYFKGKSYLNQLTQSEDYLAIYNVTFEPSCRNNWHIHTSKLPIGQVLIGVEGKGWYQEEGKEAIEVLPGMIIEIPSNKKHWHGAQEDSWFSHLAFSIPNEDASTIWGEEVSEEDYNQLKYKISK